jgi:molybdate transport system substrate-binding protein
LSDTNQLSLHILSSMATKEVLEAMGSHFQYSASQTIVTEAIGGVDAAKRVRAGESLDVVVLAAAVIDALIAEGHLVLGSRVDLVTSGIVVAVKQGADKPNLANAAAVKQAVLAAKSIGYSTGPSGAYLEKLFTQWGVFDQIKSRLVLAAPGIPVGSLVASGQAELGFQQYSELFKAPGVEVVAALPDDIQLITTFSAAISVHCATKDVAKALVAFMGGPESEALKIACGMQAA